MLSLIIVQIHLNIYLRHKIQNITKNHEGYSCVTENCLTSFIKIVLVKIYINKNTC